IISALVVALAGTPGEAVLRQRADYVDARFTAGAGRFIREAKSARLRRAKKQRREAARAYADRVVKAATQRTPSEDIASLLGTLRGSVHRVTSSRALSLTEDDHAGNPPKIGARRAWDELLGTIEEEKECLASTER